MKVPATTFLVKFVSIVSLLLFYGCDAAPSSGSGAGGSADGPEASQPLPADGENEINTAPGSVVTIGPAGGTDSLEGEVGCRWKQLSGPVQLVLDEATVSSCELTVQPTVVGIYVFELTTTDTSGRSETETVLVRVGVDQFPAGTPIAIAGADQTVGEGGPVMLDGGGSIDTDGDPLTYAWRQLDGVEVSLSSHLVVAPTFEAPFVEGDTDLVFELAVSDGVLGSNDTVTVTVLDRGLEPGDDVGAGEGAACRSDGECDDGRFCTGVERCVDNVCLAGGPQCTEADEECDENADECVPVPVEPVATAGLSDCATDADCDDSAFCNGSETCVDGQCQAGNDPCNQGETCDEANDQCAAPPECLTDDDCNDQLFCTGLEACLDGVCQAGTDPCAQGETCDDVADECVAAPECQTNADCDDVLYCNGEETCGTDGLCADGTDPCAGACEADETTECSEGDIAAVCQCTGVETTDFTLNQDDLAGTAGDDTFSAPLIFNPPSGTQLASLQTGDQADGLAGEDTLNATLNGQIVVPTLSGIETINLTALAATTLNATNISGVSTITSLDSTSHMTVSSLNAIVDAGITNTSAGLTLKFTANATIGVADAMTWTVSGVTGGQAVVESAGANGLETINITSIGATANTLDSLTQINGTSLTRLNVSGGQRLALMALPDTVNSIDASALAAQVTIDAAGSNIAMTIDGGLGNDTLVSGSGSDIVNGGAGNDGIWCGSGSDIANGGAGDDYIRGGPDSDTITGGAGNDIFVFVSGSSMAFGDTISDFLVGTDVLQFAYVTDLGSGQQGAAQEAVTALSPGATRAQILTAMVGANTTDLGVSVGTKDGNTYVLFETSGAGGFQAEDDVFIKLVGVTLVDDFTFADDVVE